MPALFIAILVLFIMLLASSRAALSLATLGLTLWFENMVPTLLPFMILSGILTGLGLQYYLLRPFRKMFTRLFHTTESGAYCIVMGFLCGFPMGAFCCADLCRKRILSRKEAARLIPFCNNIGPVYFYSFAIPLLQLRASAFMVYPLLTFGMYGIPLIFGIASGAVSSKLKADSSSDKQKYNTHMRNEDSQNSQKCPPLLEVTDEAICNAGQSMLRLGGYMILFNILMLPLYALCKNSLICASAHSAIEISGGIRILGSHLAGANIKGIRPLMLTALSFGGLCCCGQCYGFFREAGLSSASYLLKRAKIALAAGVYYWGCFWSGLLY